MDYSTLNSMHKAMIEAAYNKVALWIEKSSMPLASDRQWAQLVQLGWLECKKIGDCMVYRISEDGCRAYETQRT